MDNENNTLTTRQQLDILEERFANLLAVIHRDGGQHQASHGTTNSYHAAMRKVSAAYSTIEELVYLLDSQRIYSKEVTQARVFLK